MGYNSILFLELFLPIVTLVIYNILPQKHRLKVLLIISYIFFWAISGKLIIYLLLTTIFIHYFGLWLTSIQDEKNMFLKDASKEDKKKIKEKYLKKQRKVLLFAVLLNIGTLVIVKYSGFLGTNINSLLNLT